jgi:hypothetical protein
MEVPVGIAPTHEGFAVPCLTTWLRHHPDGGAEEIRTPDPLLAKQMLYQLSYSPLGVPG